MTPMKARRRRFARTKSDPALFVHAAAVIAACSARGLIRVIGAQAARFPEMPFRTPAAMEAHLDEALERLVRAPLAASPEEASDDEVRPWPCLAMPCPDAGPGHPTLICAEPRGCARTQLAAEIASLDLEAPRGRIQQLFREHAGGEMRLVAAGLALDIPPTER